LVDNIPSTKAWHFSPFTWRELMMPGRLSLVPAGCRSVWKTLILNLNQGTNKLIPISPCYFYAASRPV